MLRHADEAAAFCGNGFVQPIIAIQPGLRVSLVSATGKYTTPSNSSLLKVFSCGFQSQAASPINPVPLRVHAKKYLQPHDVHGGSPSTIFPDRNQEKSNAFVDRAHARFLFFYFCHHFQSSVIIITNRQRSAAVDGG